jgi:hypothetical protein
MFGGMAPHRTALHRIGSQRHPRPRCQVPRDTDTDTDTLGTGRGLTSSHLHATGHTLGVPAS